VTLEDQIYFGCAAYSMLHPNRASALNHLFCVIGNGWENGQLVEVCGETTYKNGKRMSLKAAINNIFRRRRKDDEQCKRDARNWKRRKHSGMISDAQLDKLVDEALVAEKAAKERDPVAYEEKCAARQKEWIEQKRKWREEKKWEYRIPDNIQERCKITEGYNHWYPICEMYSKLLVYPDDIQPDYLDGIIETCRLIIANPPVINPPNYPAAQSRRTVELAEKALNKALALSRSRLPRSTWPVGSL
jgi:hypothetical protein